MGAICRESVNGNISGSALLTHVLEQRQHLRVRRVIGDGEGQIRVSENGSNANQTRAATWDNADILPGILTLLALAVVVVVQTSDGRA